MAAKSQSRGRAGNGWNEGGCLERMGLGSVGLFRCLWGFSGDIIGIGSVRIPRDWRLLLLIWTFLVRCSYDKTWSDTETLMVPSDVSSGLKNLGSS